MRIFRPSIVVALLLVLSGTARAQTGTLDRYRASATPEDDFQLSRPTDLGHLRFGAQLHMDYALNPLVWETVPGDPSSETLAYVEHMLVGNVGLSLGVADRLVIYGGLPVVLVNQGADQAAVGPTGGALSDGPGLGDAYLGARFRIFGEDDDMGALGAQVTGTFPTAGDGVTYRGEPFLSIHPQVLGEIRPGAGARIVLNVGVRIREETRSTVTNLEFGHELTYGLGFAMPMWTDPGAPNTHLDVHAQIYGDTALRGFGDRTGTAIEGTAGLKLFHESGIVAGLAGGPGLARGFGSPDVRLIATFGWMMTEAAREVADPADACPNEAEDEDGFEDDDGCPDPDNDGDGILDAADRCPNEPETLNGLEDEDGCPDAVGDRDSDGIADHVDACPDEAEDRDGFEDENGCPDPDNDQDGLLDRIDRCPLEVGPALNRGCPDTDRDADTVVDRVDNCPDEPGSPANHGCVRQQRVVIAESGLEILDRVYFHTNAATIRQQSDTLLLNVALVLAAHPEITHIQIEGHTDSRGSRAHNVELSQARAERVLEFLVTQGHIDRGRLSARGFGPDRPIVEGARTRDDHAQNRRVEFNIPRTEGVETSDRGPDADAADR